LETDRYLREATHQYAEGHLDQPLWDRAFTQAKGDKEAAVDTYLHARAIALRLLDRERMTGKRAEAARAIRSELVEDEGLEDGFDADAALRSSRLFYRYRYALIAGAILVTLAAGAWLFNSFLNAKRADAVGVKATAPAGDSTSARAPAAVAASKDTGNASTQKPTGASPELMKKIQDLRDAGSSNVLVLYLVEWTRKEPANPAAWDQLRAGYVTLKQYDDALGAARKAQELAPDDARMWRNLGMAYTDAGDPVAALRAYEQAVARDERDADSFRQIGILNAQLSQIQDAGHAFDRALAIRPGDPTVLCMRSAVVALSSAPKDTYATAKQVKAIDSKCRGS